jgi:integral membrane protein (TIGR01906 family)
MLKSSKKKEWLLSIGVISLVLFVFLVSLFLFVYNPWFYDWQYTDNGIYNVFDEKEVWESTYTLWSFMLFKTDTLSGSFSEQDVLHMFDVRNILFVFECLLLMSFILLLVILVIQCRKKNFAEFSVALFQYTSYGIFGVVGVLAFLAVFFDVSFLWFHKIFFRNDLWVMDPTNDLLIQLFPEAFFQFMFIFIILVSFGVGFGLFFLSQYVKKRLS